LWQATVRPKALYVVKLSIKNDQLAAFSGFRSYSSREFIFQDQESNSSGVSALSGAELTRMNANMLRVWRIASVALNSG
jgi:hypothetical protein